MKKFENLNLGVAWSEHLSRSAVITTAPPTLMDAREALSQSTMRVVPAMSKAAEEVLALPPEEAAIARMKQRWFLDRDCAGNEYLIPADRREEWDAWDIACEEAGDLLPAPTWARPLRDQVRWVEFECPVEMSA